MPVEPLYEALVWGGLAMLVMFLIGLAGKK